MVSFGKRLKCFPVTLAHYVKNTEKEGYTVITQHPSQFTELLHMSTLQGYDPRAADFEHSGLQ